MHDFAFFVGYINVHLDELNLQLAEGKCAQLVMVTGKVELRRSNFYLKSEKLYKTRQVLSIQH